MWYNTIVCACMYIVKLPWQLCISQPPSSVLCYHLFLHQHSGWAVNLLAVWRLPSPACPHLNTAQSHSSKHKAASYISLWCKHKNIRSDVTGEMHLNCCKCNLDKANVESYDIKQSYIKLHQQRLSAE